MVGLRARTRSRRRPTSPAAVLVVGMLSFWPIRIMARESRPLAATIAATVVPYFAARWETVSPALTV